VATAGKKIFKGGGSRYTLWVICRRPFYAPLLCLAAAACSKEATPDASLAADATQATAPSTVASSLPVAAEDAAVAQLTQGAGDLRLQPVGQMLARACRPGTALHAGDVIVTGADGEATVVFAGNNAVTLAPNSTLLIRADGASQASKQMGAVVLRGSARAASGGKGVRLVVGTPAGLAEMGGARVAVMEVSIDSGLKVQAGEVSLTGQADRPSRRLTEGQTVAIDGLAIARQATTVDGLLIRGQQTTIAGLTVPQQTTVVDGVTVAQQSTVIDGVTVPQQSAVVDGLTVPQQSAVIDGVTVPQQSAVIDGVTVPQQNAVVDGVTAPHQNLAVDGLNIPGMPPPPPVSAPPALPEPAEPARPQPAAPPVLTKERAVAFAMVPARAAQVQPSAVAAMQPLVRRTPLLGGGQVRVGPNGRAAVGFGREATLTLASNAQFILQGRPTADGPLRYTLNGGGQLSLTPAGGAPPAHAIDFAQTLMQITPGARSASVDMAPQGERGHVYLRYGHVQLQDGTSIEAGQTFAVQAGKLASGPQPLSTPIAIEPGKNVELYTQGSQLPVAFVAPQGRSTKPWLVELAADRNFRRILGAEQTSRDQFALDTLPAKQLYYRLGKDPATVGHIEVLSEDDASCVACRHASAVQDTGRKTIVYYQETLPALDISWQPVQNATQYRLQIFRDGVFDHAEVDETLTQTAKALPRGRLGEGSYYWLVRATNKAGRVLSEPRTNVLQVTYDNVIQKLLVRSPQRGSKTSQDHVQTTGYVVLGSKLFINGAQAELDKQGHFDETLPLTLGRNELVYRTVSTDGTERFYSRVIERTAS
jgi:hypothetical protein